MSKNNNLSFEYLKTQEAYVICCTDEEWLEVDRITDRKINIGVYYEYKAWTVCRNLNENGYSYLFLKELKATKPDAILVSAKDFILANSNSKQQPSTEMDTPAEIKQMDFSEALKLLKTGQMLQRNSWDVNDYVIKASINTILTQEPHNMRWEIEPAYYKFIFLGDACSVQPYIPISKDLNAEDWVLRNERLNEIVKGVFNKEK